MGVGTGALIATLFANFHDELIDGLCLNSPALAHMHGFEVQKPWFGSDPFLKADNVMLVYHASLHKSKKVPNPPLSLV
jgi:alpha-beta hydrolase superfamily lysophospholipase